MKPEDDELSEQDFKMHSEAKREANRNPIGILLTNDYRLFYLYFILFLALLSSFVMLNILRKEFYYYWRIQIVEMYNFVVSSCRLRFMPRIKAAKYETSDVRFRTELHSKSNMKLKKDVKSKESVVKVHK